MELIEVKLQDPNTGNWFEKTPTEYQKYFDIFNKLYFDGQLPKIKIENMNFYEVNNPSNIAYFDKKLNILESRIENVKIVINKDYISTFEEFRNVLVHEMIHYYVFIKEPITKIQWNRAFNYVKACNETGIEINKDEIEMILGLSNFYSHDGLRREKCNYLNSHFKEFNNKLDAKYDCSIDDDSFEEFNTKNKLLFNKKTSQLYYYTDLLLDSYKGLMNNIKNGKTAMNEIVGDWYELKLNKKHFINFISQYKSASYTIKDYKVFKDFFIDEEKFLNCVKLDKKLQENYIVLLNKYIYETRK